MARTLETTESAASVSGTGRGQLPATLVKEVARDGLTVWRVPPVLLCPDEDIEERFAVHEVSLIEEAQSLVRRDLKLERVERELVIISASVLADSDERWSGDKSFLHPMIRGLNLVSVGREAICRLALGFVPAYMDGMSLSEVIASSNDGELDSDQNPIYLSFGFKDQFKFVRGSTMRPRRILGDLSKRFGLVFERGDTHM